MKVKLIINALSQSNAELDLSGVKDDCATCSHRVKVRRRSPAIVPVFPLLFGDWYRSECTWD